MSACVSVSTGEELPHLPEPHWPAEGHPAAQRHPRGQTEPGLHYTVRRHGQCMSRALRRCFPRCRPGAAVNVNNVSAGFMYQMVAAFLSPLSFQSEKLTKREVEAKFCNFSLSTNSVSAPCRKVPARRSSDVHIDIVPCPVADVVQVHRAKRGSAGAGAAADVTHQTQDRCQSTRQAGAQGPGGGHRVAA